jgi:hypothetical protein
VPFPRVPREVVNEPSFENPENWGFGGGRKIFGHLERGPMFFLDQNCDQLVTLRAKGLLLRVLSSDEAVGGDSVIFSSMNQVG